MTHATSVARPSRTTPPRVSMAALARMTVLAAVLVVVMAVAFVLCLAWLAGDGPDLYTRSSVGIDRALPIVDPVAATIRSPEARFPR